MSEKREDLISPVNYGGSRMSCLMLTGISHTFTGLGKILYFHKRNKKNKIIIIKVLSFQQQQHKVNIKKDHNTFIPLYCRQL